MPFKRKERERRSRKPSKYDFSRRAPHEEPRKRVYLFCEGAVTERLYFEALGRLYRKNVKVILSEKSGRDPLTLVQFAIVQGTRDSNDMNDEYWAVFDRDDHLSFDDAFERAKKGNIRIAFSNPCFELWILLHFQAQTANLSRTEATKRLKNHMHDYVKAPGLQQLLSNDYSRYENAKTRAQGLSKQHWKDGDPRRNPGSTVFELVESIRR
jgi:RloB-like protein